MATCCALLSASTIPCLKPKPESQFDSFSSPSRVEFRSRSWTCCALLSASTIPCLKPKLESQFGSFSSPNRVQYRSRSWTCSSLFWSTNNLPLIKKSERNNGKTEFGLRIARDSILKEINDGCKKNLVVSPLSIHIALNMLASGSTGFTLEQLLYFLKSKGITNLNDQSSLFMNLATDKNPGGPIISLVNGIWVDKSFPMKHSFKQLAEDVYKANARSVDFLNQGERVRDGINSWAREASKGHIDPLLTKPLSKDAILVLANALYFKGSWVQRFYSDFTEDEDFHLLNGEIVRVPFMKAMDTNNFYGSFDGFELLKMEYKFGKSDNKRYAMHIFLPDKKDGLQELVEKFNSDPNFLLEKRKLQLVKLDNVWLPKLRYEYELDLFTSMKELGLDLPFDDLKAEITEIVETSEVVYVSDAIQKAYIEVNEEGTIATAVTAFTGLVGASPFMKPPRPQVNFIADHPFLFMIKEDVSGTVLFVGASLNPRP